MKIPNIRNLTVRMLMAVLAAVAPLAAAAQAGTEIEGGEAFYIYQNDGHFDGFFFDQVKQISYSRLDTLGVEYKDYVSQEIVTEDSVYRIMLTAIDSVSFVQPEIKFAKSLRFMREEGMMDYFKEYIYDPDLLHVVGFDPSMPEALQPKVGDVLYCDSVTGYPDGAFVFKVTRVIPRESFLIVCCDYITDYRDVYEQFITVEQVRNTQTPEGSRTMRRVAGLKPQPKKLEGNIEEFTLFNINTGFEAAAKIYGKLSFSVTLNLNFGMTISSVYNISLTNWYFKHEMKEQFGLSVNVGLDGELYNEISPSELANSTALATFTRIPIPATGPPLFYVAALPEPASRVEAHLKLMFNSGFKAKGLYQAIESMETFPYVNLRYKFINPFLHIPTEWEREKEWSISAQLNGFVQTGVKFPIAIGTQEWFNKIFGFKTAMNVFLGPKFTGTLDIAGLKGGSDSWVPLGWYNKLKDSKVDVSLMSFDPEFKAEVKAIGGIEWDIKRTTSFSAGNFTLHLFPDIKGLNCEVKGDRMNIVNAKVKEIKGDVCLPQRLGFALYKNKDENDKEYSELYRYMTRNETYFLNTFNTFDLDMEYVEPGVYKAYPIVSTPFGIVTVENESQIVTIAGQELELKPDTITAEEAGGKFEIQVLCNLEQPVTISPDDDWLEAEVKYNVGPTKSTIMYVKVKENDTDKFRKSGITVTQELKDGGLKEKRLRVGQYGGLQLDPEKLEFEAAGGQAKVNILTSYSPITINVKDDWLSYSLDDRKLTITAKPNNGANRTATVIVAAWNPKTKGIAQVELKVTQKGIVDATVTPTELTYPFNGGTRRVDVTTGPDVTFDKVSVSQGDESWVLVEKQKDYFNVTAIPNMSTDERVAYVTATFTTKDDSGKPVTADIPVTVKQAASTASVTPDVLTFTAKGGTKEAAIKSEGYFYMGGFVDEESQSWLSAKVETDGKVTVTAKENTSGGRREGYVYCYVTNEQNPKDEDMLYLPITVKQASNIPEAPQLDIPGIQNFSHRAEVYHYKIKTNLASVKVTMPEWATAVVVGDEVQISVQRNRGETERSGFIYVTGFDEDGKPQYNYAQPIKQYTNTKLKYYRDEVVIISIDIDGDCNTYWIDSEGKRQEGNTDGSIEGHFSSKITCTEVGEYGVKLSTSYEEGGEKASLEIVIDDVDKTVYSKLDFVYDYGTSRHTELHATDIVYSPSGPVSCHISEFTDDTKNMWGLVYKKFGPYFSTRGITTHADTSGDNNLIRVYFGK